MNAKQKNQIKNQLASQVDAVTKVTIKHLKVDYKTLTDGSILVNSASGIARFIDYKFGKNGMETFKNEVLVNI